MLIKVRDLKKEFSNGEVVTKVLHGVSFDIEKGEFVSIMGPSGSGKSTLMHILGFLDKASGGEYIFEEEDVSTLSDDELAERRSKKIGFIFQSFNLLTNLTVLENVTLPLIYSNVSSEERNKRGKQLLEQVGLSHRLNYNPNKLSGGEKQRVAIARAFVNNPDVIFADEPTGNLDSKTGESIIRLLKELNKAESVTVILVTHDKNISAKTDRVITLVDGKNV